MTKMIVGLGNPGSRYNFNRHNIGFIVLDLLQRFYELPDFSQKGNYLYSKGRIKDHDVILVKPSTYMNLSGNAVQAALQFYKIPREDLWVIHDDLDLPLGKIRCKQGGGHGGHNGLRNIDAQAGLMYWRLRFGIDRPWRPEMVSAHVLSDFTRDEEATIGPIMESIVEFFPTLLTDNQLFMTKIALNLKPLKEQ